MRDGWNHNTHYHDLLLREVPADCARALDVGCGLGGFTRKLATRSAHVDAIDVDADVIARARTAAPVPANVQFDTSDFIHWAGVGQYDYVSMVAVLHQMDFHRALMHAAALLRTGGVLAVLGLARP